MWALERIRESVESIPLDLSRYMGKQEKDAFFPSKPSLHCNILTPDKIPEFCLPPQLCRRSPLPEAEKTRLYLQPQNQLPKTNTSSNTARVKSGDVNTRTGDSSVVWKAAKKALPFSAEGYGLAGLYESPNTRRKESLFHSKCPAYVFQRGISTGAPRLARKPNLPKKAGPGFLPLQQCKILSKTGSAESEAQFCSDSSLLTSPSSTAKSSCYIASNGGRLKGAVSCPSLTINKEDKRKLKRGGLTITSSSRNPLTRGNNTLSLAPPILFPLDVLQCQERLRHEHVLPLQGRGRVRLSTERTTFSKNIFSTLSTVRIRVVSVEGLWDDAERQTLNCAVNLCLTPGKLQQQESATIRNCRTPVFNEDFFFIELSLKDLQELQLRLKVVDKPASGPLRRGTVIGIVIRPLSQLLPLDKREDK
ncbi:C2 calcium-dependent domain-containing protein 4C [Salarias fasciatus]|uniref:C2 calcium-dependent domain-containing protein 4C n=1 Tax=Salarias fasciatus TaxID=181472 RepID=UPI001176D098|nr:C2 calcium-dependent domain-containing protein 4C-like [Salarias fasciatus]